jgi:RNA polymerase sigma-70 factor (ECF subfamily)
MLPRLGRLAIFLTADEASKDLLLRRVCARIIKEKSVRQGDTTAELELGIFCELCKLWREKPEDYGIGNTGLSEQQKYEWLTYWQQNHPSAGNREVVNSEVYGYLGSLHPMQRVALVLVYGEGFSYETTAEILNTSAGAVMSAAAAARTTIADMECGPS